eukprot:1973342-Pleurochrysis_carterae.AAC.1
MRIEKKRAAFAYPSYPLLASVLVPLEDPSAALIVVERLATAFLSAAHAARRPSAMLPDLEGKLADRKALVQQCIQDARSPEQ